MPIHKVLALWKSFSKSRFGKRLFSYLIRFVNPYSGTLGAQIDVFEKGYAEVYLPDKRKNRNHLDSIHAIALTNLGELTSGIAVLGSLPSNVRGIVTHISIDFFKKARGTLKAVCKCSPPEVIKDTEYIVKADIFNAEDELVSQVSVTWQLGCTE